MTRPRIALVVDPRFSGGTSAAIAQELPEIAKHGSLRVFAITSAMFGDEPSVNPVLKDALSAQGLTLDWDPKVISADVIILHNPSFLKFNTDLATRFVADRFIAVTHENFLSPQGNETFEVARCLDLIEDRLLCRHQSLAPVSDYNRDTVAKWLHNQESDWQITPANWFNICDLKLYAPTARPKDRRGRHSRPGFEKFPDQTTMNLLYPPEAEANVILGGDSFIGDDAPSHWALHPFRAMPVSTFFESIDFFVYFTNTRWRESFGRAIAEAIAAGKLVITDPDTARNIGPDIIGVAPTEVNSIISKFIANPKTYEKAVRLAQQNLSAYSAAEFNRNLQQILTPAGDAQ